MLSVNVVCGKVCLLHKQVGQLLISFVYIL